MIISITIIKNLDVFEDLIKILYSIINQRGGKMDEPCPVCSGFGGYCGGSRYQNCGIFVAGRPATREEADAAAAIAAAKAAEAENSAAK